MTSQPTKRYWVTNDGGLSEKSDDPQHDNRPLVVLASDYDRDTAALEQQVAWLVEAAEKLPSLSPCSRPFDRALSKIGAARQQVARLEARVKELEQYAKELYDRTPFGIQEATERYEASVDKPAAEPRQEG